MKHPKAWLCLMLAALWLAGSTACAATPAPPTLAPDATPVCNTVGPQASMALDPLLTLSFSDPDSFLAEAQAVTGVAFQPIEKAVDARLPGTPCTPVQAGPYTWMGYPMEGLSVYFDPAYQKAALVECQLQLRPTMDATMALLHDLLLQIPADPGEKPSGLVMMTLDTGLRPIVPTATFALPTQEDGTVDWDALRQQMAQGDSGMMIYASLPSATLVAYLTPTAAADGARGGVSGEVYLYYGQDPFEYL